MRSHYIGAAGTLNSLMRPDAPLGLILTSERAQQHDLVGNPKLKPRD